MLRIILVLGVLAGGRLAAANCIPGDLACACKEAHGSYRSLQQPLRDTCTFEFKQNVGGREVTRTFNVFLPKGFKTTRTYPVWMHIHGVYWGSMDNISQRMGWNVLAMDATAGWDGLVGSSKVDNSAIVVYPQSTPSPYTDPSQRMLWNLPWWSCSAGSCVDKDTDEVAYMETVLHMLLSKFPVDKNKFFVSGTSAGGMMVNLLLCKSALFQNTVTAVADILGGVGESFMNQCSPSKFVPHLILHGQNDPIITYYNDNLVDNSKFISTLKMASWWQGMQGCTGEPRTVFTDQILECSIYCESQAAAERRPMANKKMATRRPVNKKKIEASRQSGGRGPVLKLCGMKGVGHDLNTPYHGYPFDITWDFFKQQMQL